MDEAADLLCCFNFIPEQFGRFKLKKKRCVIDYIEPTEKYKNMRAGSVAEILMPDASTFTNQIKVDKSLISGQRLIKPIYIIKFSKRESDWFTVWNDCIIAKYNKEKVSVLNMKPYLDRRF